MRVTFMNSRWIAPAIALAIFLTGRAAADALPEPPPLELTCMGDAGGGESAVNPGLPALLSYEGRPCWVTRPGGAALPDPAPASAALSQDARNEVRLRRMIEAQLAGPLPEEAARGIARLLPAGTRLDSLEIRGAAAEIRVTFPGDFLEAEFSDFLYDELLRLGMRWAERLDGVETFEWFARAAGEAEFRPLFDFVAPQTPPGSKPAETALPAPALSTSDVPAAAPGGARAPLAGQAVARGNPQPAGALSGASVFLSPGHGWYWSGSAWVTQRFATSGYNIIEDHINADACFQWLTRYLWNAGARVYSCRERDMNRRMIIVDNGAAGYTETGAWTAATATGAYGGAMRVAATVAGAPTATAQFVPNIPESGYYGVYVWYRPALTGTTTQDARVIIRHSGGETLWV